MASILFKTSIKVAVNEENCKNEQILQGLVEFASIVATLQLPEGSNYTFLLKIVLGLALFSLTVSSSIQSKLICITSN